MKRLLILSLFVILVLPLIAYATDAKKSPSLFQQLKQAGRAAKESAKDVSKGIKKDAKDAAKDIKETGRDAKRDLRSIGEEAKESGKGFTNTLKNSFKQAGKAFSDALHGFLDFLGFGTKDKNKKKDIPSENVSLYSLRTT